MPFVLDNSVVCGWLLQNQADDYTAAIAVRLRNDRALAPALLPLEYTNVLRTACKRGVLQAREAQEMLGALQEVPIELADADPAPAQILALALRYDLTSYDAAYLDLALARQLPMATRDKALAQAARAAGVGVVEK